jgi:GH24 family phage-related lysozyme (muramidase)
MAPQPNKKLAAVAVAIVLSGLGTVEGNRLVTYRDAVGILTNCAGNTHGVYAGQVLTTPECAQINKKNATLAMDAVWDALDNPSSLPASTLAAFGDFQFNTGAFPTSTSRKLVNQGAIAEGCNDLYRWVYAGRPLRRLQGLWNRRDYEVKLCLKDLK